MELQEYGEFLPPLIAPPPERTNRTKSHMAKMRARRAPLEKGTAAEMGKKGAATRRLALYNYRRLVAWPKDKWLDVEKICFVLGVRPQTARRYISRGELGQVRVVGRNTYYVQKSEVRKWVKRDAQECLRILAQ